MYGFADRSAGLACQLLRRVCGVPDRFGEGGVAEGMGAGVVDEVDAVVG
jgi:hypothetical protein